MDNLEKVLNCLVEVEWLAIFLGYQFILSPEIAVVLTSENSLVPVHSPGGSYAKQSRSVLFTVCPHTFILL